MGLRRFGGPGMHGIGGVPLSSMGGAFHGGYFAKVLATGPIAYWPLWEASGTVAQCLVNPLQNGTYNSDVSTWPTGTGIGDGNSAPFFDGTNDFVDIFTPTFAAAFSGTEGSAMIWAKVANAGVWTDGAYRAELQLRQDFNNRMLIYKTNANNTQNWQYVANADSDIRTKTPYNSTDWFCLGITWSDSGNQAIAYIDGAQEGAVLTPIGTWAGAVITRYTAIGCVDTVALTYPWLGWLAHCVSWDRVLSQPEFAYLATV